MKLEITGQLKKYIIKCAVRTALFLTALFWYLTDRDLLYRFRYAFFGVFVLMMLRHLFPNAHMTAALLKREGAYFEPEENYSKRALLAFVKERDRGALLTLLSWILLNGIVAAFFYAGFLDKIDLLMLTIFYFLCDYLCILFFCPFQSFLMKNKCCISCRIYDWGHLMMFTPMAFIGEGWALCLFLTAAVVVICWETAYRRHPERFWEGSNKKLRCQSCRDRTCQIKRELHSVLRL